MGAAGWRYYNRELAGGVRRDIELSSHWLRLRDTISTKEESQLNHLMALGPAATSIDTTTRQNTRFAIKHSLLLVASKRLLVEIQH